MNLLDMIQDEIGKKNLTKDEIIRYIYLRVCQLFYYDTRVQYAKLLGDKKTYNDIIEKKLDIKNITDRLCICYNISKDVLKKLIEEFTSRDVRIEDMLGHAYALTTFNNEKYSLDPAIFDMTRVKMKLQTKDFCPHRSHLKDTALIDDMDKSLGFDEYTMTDMFKLDGYNDAVEKIITDLENSECTKNYTDASYFVSRLFDHYGVEDEIAHETYVSDQYDFHNIYKFVNGGRYFDLCKKSGDYIFKEVSKEKCRHIVIGKEAYHRDKIFKGY